MFHALHEIGTDSTKMKCQGAKTKHGTRIPSQTSLVYKVHAAVPSSQALPGYLIAAHHLVRA